MGLFSFWVLIVLSKSGLTLKHRTYVINESDEDFLEMSRGKLSVKKGLWYVGGAYKRAKKRWQKGGAIPIGLLASIGTAILGEIAKPIPGKIFSRGHRRKRRWKIK